MRPHQFPAANNCSSVSGMRMKNLFKAVHGGVIASLVDIIGTAAIVTTGTVDTGVSVDINVTYVSAAVEGVCTISHSI